MTNGVDMMIRIREPAFIWLNPALLERNVDDDRWYGLLNVRVKLWDYREGTDLTFS